MYAAAVKSVIRRDLARFWPVVALLVLLQLALTLYPEWYRLAPSWPVRVGDTTFMAGKILPAITIVAPPLLMLILIVLLVQADPPHDAHADWRARPISPGALLTAKVLALLAFCVLPTFVGSLVHDLSIQVIEPFRSPLINTAQVFALSAGALTLAYLATSRLQAFAFIAAAPVAWSLSLFPLVLVFGPLRNTVPLTTFIPAGVALMAIPLYLVLVRRRLGWARASLVLMFAALMAGLVLTSVPQTA